MANMLRRVCHVAFVLATLWWAGGLYAQAQPLVVEKKTDSDLVRRKAMESRPLQTQTPLEQAEKDLAAAKKELEEYEKAVQHYFKRCGNEVMEVADELVSARRRLVELEKNKGAPDEIKAVKEKISGYERYFHEMEQERLANPLSKHDITQVANGLRRKVADLVAVRDRLKAKAGSTPVKKAP